MNTLFVLVIIIIALGVGCGLISAYHLGVSDGIWRELGEKEEDRTQFLRNNSYGKSDSNNEEATD